MSAAPLARLLVVEPDRARGEAIARQLLADGFAVELARTAEHARILARGLAPDLAVLGALDTGRGALALLEEIRDAPPALSAWDRRLPAIVLGSRGDELELLRAFEAGADDFLLPRAGYLELRARLRAVLRRARTDPNPARELCVAGLVIDTYTRTATLRGRALTLRRMEFDLLVELAREPQRAYARDELLRSVWGYRAGGSTRTVDSHASRLRRKLQNGSSERWVLNVWGVGYRLT